MDDRAVSPVVAAMLLLAVLVTFLSAYNAVVIPPSLKQQAEVEHLHAVEESFLAFGSDMTAAAALKQDMRLSKRIPPLGGGDMILDPVRSGGDAPGPRGPGRPGCERDPERDDLLLQHDGGSPTPPRSATSGVTRGMPGSTATPTSPTESSRRRSNTRIWRKFARQRRPRGGSPDRSSGSSTRAQGGNCTGVRISLVTFEPGGDDNLASGNGIGTLSLDATVEDMPINLTADPEIGGVAVNTALPVPLNASLWENCNAAFHAMNETYNNVKDCTSSSEDGLVTLTFADGQAPGVTLRLVRVVVSAR